MSADPVERNNGNDDKPGGLNSSRWQRVTLHFGAVKNIMQDTQVVRTRNTMRVWLDNSRAQAIWADQNAGA